MLISIRQCVTIKAPQTVGRRRFMKYLKRKADAFLLNWKSQSDRLPLVVKGARQIGKTETIRKFAAENYESVVEINFVTEPKYKAIIENGYSASEIIKLITLISPEKELIPGKTLLFFDEIQAFPEIATSLKFFYEDGRFDVICSGSLLGIQYKHIASISVGYKMDYPMHSMDFEEFLWAKGYGASAVDNILDHMLSGKPFTDIEQRVYSGLFMDFCVLGGMPNIVSKYVEQGTFQGSLMLQRQLLIDYESDVRKYAEGLDQAKIINVYRSVPAQLAKENKKFQYSLVEKGGRSKDYMGCIDWLSDAGLINICRCMSFPSLPLKGNTDGSKFKVYVADTGLLVASLDDEAQEDLRANQNLGIYKGALYENFAAEALIKQGYDLYYYKKDNSTLKADFFMRSANELIPVEIKEGTNQSKSLRQLIQSSHYPDILHGLKFTAGNIGYSDTVCTFPYFCMFLLRRFMQQQSFFK